MKLSLYIFAICFLCSCEHGYELTELYSQRIERSDKLIIEYKSWSTLNDGSKYGKTILNKNETIGIGNAEQIQFNFLLGKSTKDTLYTLQLIGGGSKIPKYISTEISKQKGLNIKTDIYSYDKSTYSLNYDFLNFRETEDSLIFSGIEMGSFNEFMNKNEISFLKGNVKLVESNSQQGVISRIEVPAFLLNENMLWHPIRQTFSDVCLKVNNCFQVLRFLGV